MKYNEPEEFDKSEFNEAYLKMRRLNEGQQLLNSCWLDPLGYNDSFLIRQKKIRNFDLIFRAVCSLYQEIRSKCTAKERDLCEQYRKALREFVKKYPIIGEVKNGVSKTVQETVNMIHWEAYEQALEKYESYVRQLLDEHGFGTPTAEGEGLF